MEQVATRFFCYLAEMDGGMIGELDGYKLFNSSIMEE